MSDYYILDDERRPVLEPDQYAWSEWMHTRGNKVVCQTDVGAGVLVSTVFLGIDHNFSGRGPPVLFETMVFGAEEADDMYESDCFRYSSWDNAEAGHQVTVRRWQAKVEAIKKSVGGTMIRNGDKLCS